MWLGRLTAISINYISSDPAGYADIGKRDGVLDIIMGSNGHDYVVSDFARETAMSYRVGVPSLKSEMDFYYPYSRYVLMFT